VVGNCKRSNTSTRVSSVRFVRGSQSGQFNRNLCQREMDCSHLVIISSHNCYCLNIVFDFKDDTGPNKHVLHRRCPPFGYLHHLEEQKIKPSHVTTL
jgi:hypothetical protein